MPVPNPTKMRLPHPLRYLFTATVLALAALVSGSPAMAAPPPGIPDGWSDGFVYANGIRIHYYRAVPAPGKPVMVMVHGLSDIGLSWTTLTWKLQEAYDIYMVDARGHGLTDPFTPSDDGETLVKDVLAFLEAMKLEKPIMMGHSMGAATVIKLGAQYPDLSKAIIMLDPILRPFGPPPAGRATEPSSPASGERSDSAPARPARRPGFFGTPESLVATNNKSFDELVATCRRQTPKWDIVDCQYWALSKKQYHGAYTTEAQDVMSGVMRVGDSLSKITVPALILKADAAPDVRQFNEEAARVMQRGKLVHIDDAGHNLHHDDLKRTVEVLNEFLSTL
jgi:pimeloyl-ACP methyl ester carboxylesterase